jgi:hypothetical protein
MARKHGFRFGLRDIFAGRLRVAQGQRWRIANFELLPSPRLGAFGGSDLRRTLPSVVAIPMKKPAVGSTTAGLQFFRC